MDKKYKKILIIDDDEGILEALSTLFLLEGYRVYTSTKGSEAKHKIRKERPDVILLDVLLSGEDGRDIVKKLKRDTNTQQIPVIMLSAHPGARDTALAAGANDFLAKPFDMYELLMLTKRFSN